MKPTARMIAALALAGALTGWTHMGAAQEASDDEPARADARRLAHLGDRAFTIGRCDKAIPLWQRANDRFFAPTILLRIARCQALMGKVVDATKTLQAIVDSPTQANEPKPFTDAREQAASELPNVRARMAHVRVRVDARDLDVHPTVMIDSEPIAREMDWIELDPGTHQVRVEARGGLWETAVDLQEGSRRTVSVALGEEVSPPPPRTQRTVGFVIGGIGLASLAVGAYFGASAATTARDLNGACGKDRKFCPQDRQDDIDRLKTHAILADLTLGGGAALFAAGAIVVLTESPPKPEEPRIEFFTLGLGGGVRGAF